MKKKKKKPGCGPRGPEHLGPNSATDRLCVFHKPLSAFLPPHS